MKDNHKKKQAVSGFTPNNDTEPGIIFLMNAHNSEHFIEETIISVLSQTFSDIRLIIHNNGSTDRTGEICKQFARRDPRIQYLESKKSFITDDGIPNGHISWWPELNSEFVSVIDHDDILEPEFAETMYRVTKQQDADITVCGCYFFQNSRNNRVGLRIPPGGSFIDPSQLEPLFPELYGSLRTVWGKLYKTALYRAYYNECYTVPEDLHLCTDTWFVFHFLEYAGTMVSVDKALYGYRMSDTSQFHSSTVEPYRIGEADILYHKAYRFLQQRQIDTERNVRFLSDVHLGHMADLLNVLCAAQSMGLEAKIEYIQEILKNRKLQEDILFPDSFESMMGILENILQKLIPDPETASPLLWKYFIVRIWDGEISRKRGEGMLGYGMLVSGICDPENVWQFGAYLLGHPWGEPGPGAGWTAFGRLPWFEQLTCLRDVGRLKGQLQAMAQAGYPGEQALQERIEAAMEAMDFEAAIHWINETANRFPLNEYAVYYRIYIASCIGENALAVKLTYSALIFFQDCGELQQLCNEIIGNCIQYDE